MNFGRRTPAAKLLVITAFVALLQPGAQAQGAAPGREATGATVGQPAGPALASDAPTVKAASTPGDAGLASSGQEAKIEPNCHGPLYYKIKQEAENKAKYEADRAKMMDFTYAVQDILVRERETANKRSLAQKLVDSNRCAAARKFPSFLCTAYSKQNVDACFRIPDSRQMAVCRVLLGLELGSKAAFADAKLYPNPFYQRDDRLVAIMMDFVRSDRVDCQALSASDQEKCNQGNEFLAKAGSDPKALVDPMPELVWILALKKKNPEYCSLLPDPDQAELCRAYLQKDLSICRIQRPLDMIVDQDSSCGSVLLSTRLHPLSKGSEVVLTLGSPYSGYAACSIEILVEFGGTTNRREVKKLALGPNDVVELRVPLAGEKFLRAEPKCQWYPAAPKL